MPKQEAESELPGDEFGPKKTHANIFGKSTIQKGFCALYDQCRAPSMWSAAPASRDFSVAHSGIYDIEQRVNSKHHINKRKATGSTLKISH